MSPLASRASRDLGRRQRARGRPWLVGALTATTAVALGLLAWFAATSVAWFAAAPTADPLFGPLNRCLVDLVHGPRAGFAVAPDGRAAAAFSGSGVAECRMQDAPSGGEGAGEIVVEGLWLDVAAVVDVAFDFDSVLWISSGGSGEQPVGLYRKLRGEPPELMGDMVAVALAGHAHGVAAVDVAGRLYSVAADGRVLGFADLGEAAPAGLELTADASGEWLALVAGGVVALFRAATVEQERVESPCAVTFLWWLDRPGQALVSCAPQGSLALVIDAATGEREAAPPVDRERAWLVPGQKAWVKDCDRLPCSARAP